MPYHVNTETRGRLQFTELPKGTYFAEGVNGTTRGQAYYFTNDNGTCLIPIYKEDGSPVIDEKRAGRKI